MKMGKLSTTMISTWFLMPGTSQSRSGCLGMSQKVPGVLSLIPALLLMRWNRFPELTGQATLICIEYDYRDVLEPIVEYIENVQESEFPFELLTVVIPEFISPSLATQLLHNQTANVLRMRLRAKPGIIVIEIPFHIFSKMKSRQQTQISEMEAPQESSSDTEMTDETDKIN